MVMGTTEIKYGVTTAEEWVILLGTAQSVHGEGIVFLSFNNQLLITQKVEAEIQLQSEELDFMVATGDLDEIEEVNSNCILMANLQQASTSGTQTDNAPVYDNGSAEAYKKEQDSYDKAYNDMQQKIERLQAQLGDLKGIANQNVNQSGNGNVVVARAEGNGNGNANNGNQKDDSGIEDKSSWTQ
ncbi:hypothetical protein Tco_0280462 [Tanacetum coccineum]